MNRWLSPLMFLAVACNGDTETDTDPDSDTDTDTESDTEPPDPVLAGHQM